MNRARLSSWHTQTACSGCHLARDHSAATTRGVGVISPTRAVNRGTPSPLWLHYTENSGLQEMNCSATSPRFNYRHVERRPARSSVGNGEGKLVTAETGWTGCFGSSGLFSSSSWSCSTKQTRQTKQRASCAGKLLQHPVRLEASLMLQAWIRRRISCGEVFVRGS